MATINLLIKLKGSSVKVDNKTVSYLLKLWFYINFRRKVQFFLLITLALVMSIAELATIGLVVPFITILISPDKVKEGEIYSLIVGRMGYIDDATLLIYISALFALAGVMSAGVRLLNLYFVNKYTFTLGGELSVLIYERTLFQSYEQITLSNSGELIDDITNKSYYLINNIILPVVNIIGGVFVLIFVAGGLLIIQPIATIVAFVTLALAYILMIYRVRVKIRSVSNALNSDSGTLIKILQEAFGNIRDVILSGARQACVDSYRKVNSSLRKAQAYSVFIGQSPRLVIEALAICLVASAGYWVSKQGLSAEESFPILAALGLGAQRLLPIMQQIYNAHTTIQTHYLPLVSSVETLGLKQWPLNEGAEVELSFNYSIEFKNVSFKYASGQSNALTSVNFFIRKGQRVGIIGSSGGGKSTLIDILMGLLQPSSGSILIDGVPLSYASLKSWQKHIAHVPQSIYLLDGSVEQNIAFSERSTTVNLALMEESARKSCLDEFVVGLPDKYQTRVGERGALFSGGQRQRIGVARAIYKNKKVFVLDEATSALDVDTEEKVMNSLLNTSHEATFFIVAHRLSTLRCCDLVLELSNGMLTRIGSYDEVIGS